MEKNLSNTHDMPYKDFKRNGYELIDWITEYLRNIESYPVLPGIKPGDIKAKIDSSPPLKGEDLSNVFKDIDKIIIPGMTHWNHPNFNAYFNSTGSGPGILAELLSAAFNINGMLWKSCPSATELEEVTLNWLKQMLGLPENFFGIIYDGGSSSTFQAMVAAREYIPGADIKTKGTTGRTDLKRLRIYASDQGHSSIDKAAIILGVGFEGIRKIDMTENYEVIPQKLEEAIKEDIQNGWMPFFVTATVGTTSTTAIDPIKEIAEICNKYNVWLHVDGAHGGIAAILPEKKHIIDGLELADSFVVNPHKWMFCPMDVSAFYTKHPQVLKRAFSLMAEYLKTDQDDSAINYMDYGMQLGRRFRSLKLWFVIRYFGVEGLQKIIREHIRLGKLFEQYIDKSEHFEKLAPAPLSTVCFRANPGNMNEDQLNKLNEKLMNEINDTGEIFISHTKLGNKFTIRYVVSSLRTEERHVVKAWELIQKKYFKLIK
ncbi:MAG: aminotransferase class I/II-fold pyridoxal phosphate-dependent enzyme [Ignavibacteria bacterium]